MCLEQKMGSFSRSVSESNIYSFNSHKKWKINFCKKMLCVSVSSDEKEEHVSNKFLAISSNNSSKSGK